MLPGPQVRRLTGRVELCSQARLGLEGFRISDTLERAVAFTQEDNPEGLLVKRWKYLRRMGGRYRLLGGLALVGLASGCEEARLHFVLASGLEPGKPISVSHEGGLVDGTDRPFDSSGGTDASDTTGVVAARDAGAGGGAFADALAPAPSVVAIEPPLALDGAPAYSDYVRLTHQQWENSVVDNLRLSAQTGYLETLTPDSPSRYSNNETVLLVREALVLDYQTAAEEIAQRIANDAAALANVSTSREPATFIAEVGRRFYRRPLTTEEQATYLAVYETGAGLAEAGGDSFAAGAQLLIQTWIQAPNFLYRVEHSEGLLNGYEVATRLALLLTDSTPSDALLDAAQAGKLETADDVRNAASGLLATPRAALVWRRFHDETFALERLKATHIDAALELDPSLNAQLIEASHRFFDRQLREQHGLREFLLSDVGYVGAAMAPFYGVDAPADGGFVLVTFGPARRGFFAQLPSLMIDSINENPSPFWRGSVFTRYLLCQPDISTPPSTPPLMPPPSDQPTTNRERSTATVSPDECQACHRYIDPFGFAFENFDGLGRERTLDNGLPVDPTGVYPYSENQPFADSTELMTILAESPLAHRCYGMRLSEFALGRSLAIADTGLIDDLQDRSLNDDESLLELVMALVGSEPFRSAGVAP